MPVYFFWGEDDFAITQAVNQLKAKVLDPNWLSFNYDKLSGEQEDLTIQGLNQSMTPVFGMGGRLIWLTETHIGQNCSEGLLKELNRTLPIIAENVYLVFTSSKKPDGRLKVNKFLQKYATIKEFALIPPWKTDEIVAKVQTLAQTLDLKLTSKAKELLVDAVGNDSRRLWNELKKLRLYAGTNNQVLDENITAALVSGSSQNSLHLANSILNGNTVLGLQIVRDLINANEPALKIVAVLVGQFRTWLMVKLMLESGSKDEKAIASRAEIPNPKRLYFLKPEIQGVNSEQLLGTLPLLLDLEFNLKRGSEPLATLQTKVIEMCQIYSTK